MEEKIIKIILSVVIIAAIILALIIPRTGLKKYLRMNEPLFVATNVLGAICGLAGLILSLTIPETVIRLHLWELIILPFAIIYIYWAMIADAQKDDALVDEKQAFNMSRGIVVSWCVSIIFMAVVFTQYQNGNLSGGSWFLLFFFQTLMVFSAATLYFYKYE